MTRALEKLIAPELVDLNCVWLISCVSRFGEEL